MYLGHDAEPIATPNLLNVTLAIFAAKQMKSEIDHFAAVGKSDNTSVAIEIGTQSHVFYSHNADGVFQMVNGIEDGCLTVFA